MTTQELVERSFFNADDLSLLIMEHPDAPQYLAVKIANEHDAAMARRLSEMEAALRAQEWQPIETAPKDGTLVLVWMEPVPDPRYIPTDGPMAVIASYVVWSEAMKREGMKDGWSWYGPVRCQPTHWRPLPTPPAHDKGEPQP